MVFGLSGGLDSCVVAHLAREALGKTNSIALVLPYKITAKSDLGDANTIIETLGIESKLIDITPMVDAYFLRAGLDDGPDTRAKRIRRGNMTARERMAILYDHAKEYNALVLGTGNKTERLLGYFTRYGDGAYDINPIGSLYKTQVRQIARYLGAPQRVIDKPPTAGLWPGQTDEGELGFLYQDVDRLLYCMVDRKLPDAGLKKMGFTKDFIKVVKSRLAKNRYKIEPAPIALL